MDIAMIGMAVMGSGLALNLESKGYSVAVYDKFPALLRRFEQSVGTGKRFVCCETLPQLVAALKKPRVVMLMVRAGDPVDELTAALLELLEPGDVLIDGGNSWFKDTVRRIQLCREKGVHFVGAGISGGEHGARNGPSIMVGGAAEAYEVIREMLCQIAAKSPSGEPCCQWVGREGAGHYVKMVHNGIEYASMQAICETYHGLRTLNGLDNEQIAKLFRQWHGEGLSTYLVDITARVLLAGDEKGFYVERILDAAGQKGTGKWTSQEALDLGVAIPTITEAVFLRYLSAGYEQRRKAAKQLAPAALEAPAPKPEDWKQALYACTLLAYEQGFALLEAAEQTYGWGIDLTAAAKSWESGCILQSGFLGEISAFYAGAAGEDRLLTSDFYACAFAQSVPALRRVLMACTAQGVPAPTHSSGLAYYDASRCARLPVNLLQAQRDYFGAHTVRFTDDPTAEGVHLPW